MKTGFPGTATHTRAARKHGCVDLGKVKLRLKGLEERASESPSRGSSGVCMALVGLWSWLLGGTTASGCSHGPSSDALYTPLQAWRGYTATLNTIGKADVKENERVTFLTTALDGGW